MLLIDLTHTITQDMPYYPGDKKPEMKQTSDIKEHGECQYQITSGLHLGTHIDAPMHMVPGGLKLSEVGAGRFMGRGVLIDVRGESIIDTYHLEDAEIRANDVVLFLTGWDKKFRTPDYYQNFPILTETLATRLADLSIKIVGLDTPGPDQSPYEVHKILLGANILIVENLTNLQALLAVSEFEVIALPPKFEADAGPVRAVARVP